MATLKRVFNLHMEDEVFDRIKLLAKDEHRSMNNMIEHILIKYLEEKENKEANQS